MTQRPEPPGPLASDTAMRMGRWSWDLVTNEVACSPEILEIHGLDAAEIVPRSIDPFTECLHPEDRPRVFAAIERTVAKRRPGHTVYHRVCRPDGEVRHVLSRARLHLGEDGAPRHLAGVLIDLTDERVATDEQTLDPVDNPLSDISRDDAQGKHRTRPLFEVAPPEADPFWRAIGERDDLLRILDAMPVMVTLYNPEVDFAFANRTFEQVTGWTPEAVAGRPIMELTYPDPDYRAEVSAFMEACAGWKEVRLVATDGGTRLTCWTNVRLSQNRRLGIGLDLTTERDLDRALRTAQSSLDMAQEVAGIGTFEWDIAGDVNRWSPEIERLYDLPAGRFGQTYAAWAERVHPDDIAGAEAAVRESFRTGWLSAEWRARRADGTTFWIEARARVEKDAQGRPLRMYGVNLDVTERRALEEALRAEAQAARERADEFEAVSAAAPIGIALFTTDFRFIWCNAWLAGLNGTSAGSVAGRAVEDVLGAQTTRVLREIQPRLLAGERAEDVEISVADPETGAARAFAVSYVPLFGPQGQVTRFLGIVRDVTERRRAEEVRQTALEEQAHRVKNIFAVVQSIASRTFLGADPGGEDPVTVFRERLAALARSHDALLEGETDTADLGDIVRGTVAPFASPGRIATQGPPVELSGALAHMLGLALHELATNALKYGALSQDASADEAGRVAISWAVTEAGEGPHCTLRWRERGGPPVAPPARRSFGSRLIETALRGHPGARVELRFPPHGVECDMTWRL